MKFRVLLTSPPPPDAPAGAKELIEEFFIEAADHDAVVALFEKQQQSGLAHLQGRTIKLIEPVQ